MKNFLLGLSAAIAHSQEIDGLQLLQHQAQKVIKVDSTSVTRGLFDKISGSQVCRPDGTLAATKNVELQECKDMCKANAECKFVAFWGPKNNPGQWKRFCRLYARCTKIKTPKGQNAALFKRAKKPTTTTTPVPPPVDPVNPVKPVEPVDPNGPKVCDEAADALCHWRHKGDNNTCDDDGCGNRAEFRRKFAMLPPVEAPENAEPDDIIAEAGGVPPANKQFHNLHFTAVSDNDLEGGGIRYTDVTTLEVDGEDRAIDCIVTAAGYTPFDASKNGLRGKVGTINVMHSTSVELTFSFVDQQTNQPATLGEFFFSVFDIDTGNDFRGMKAVEKLTIGGYKEYYVIPQEKGGELAIQNNGNGADFMGTVHGVESDNPTDPLVLSERQAKRTVNFKFAPGSNNIRFTYSVGEATNKGRNFQFAGMTNLYFCKAPKVNLDFSLAKVVRSNLGNDGPDNAEKEGLLYSNVATVGDQAVDLEVNALSEYFPFNTERNGLNGQFAQINLAVPDNKGRPGETGATGTCEFSFTLKKGGTDEPYEAEWLYFSMFDIDQAKKNKKWNPKWQESMTVSGFASQFLSSDTQVKVEQLDKKTYRYNSSQFGTGKDNPKDPLKLDDLQSSRTATFVYRAVSRWTATFAIGLPFGRDGRNFLLAGKSSTVSCEQNTYGDVINVQAHVTPPPR